MRRLLLLNCIVAERARDGFDRDIAPRLTASFGGPSDVAYLAGDDALPDASRHSHLVLSGSELSASQGAPRDDELMATIRDFVERGRSVFGICYGHQMIARALCDTRVCRRAATPEFGWKRLQVQPDPLFDGIGELVSVHSHYDEVFDLPPPFRVIATTDDCAVQAFAYGDLPVWGTQFHPEQTLETGRAMLESNLRTEPRAPELFVDELEDPAVLANNDRLFANFFAAGRGALGEVA